MSIAFRGIGNQGGGTLTAAPGHPAGLVAGDVLVCVASGTGNVPFTWGGGGTWTEVAAFNISATRRIEVRWSRYGAGDAAPTVTLAAANIITARIAAYSGCIAAGSPIDQVGATTVQTLTTLTYKTITPTVVDSEVILCGGGQSTAVAGYSGANPAPVERFDGNATLGSQANVHLASGPKNDLTATGDRTATLVSAQTIGTVMFNLKPAAVDTTGPVVAITEPTAGQIVNGVISVQATATDPSGVASVQLRVDGSNFGAALTTGPYAWSVDTTTLTEGDHLLTAHAIDTAGNPTTSAAVLVHVQNADVAGPTVDITAPADGANVLGTITINVTATDPGGVASVQIQADGVPVAADTTDPYSVTFDTTVLGNGAHVLTAVATDTAGNQSTDAITINVGNDVTPPAVALTSPDPGAFVGATLELSALADDPDFGGVASVTFEIDGVEVASDLTAPYVATVDTAALGLLLGTHVARAVGRDAAGNIGYSTPVTFTIGELGTGTFGIAGADGGTLLVVLEAVPAEGDGTGAPGAPVRGLRVGPLSFPAPLAPLGESLGDGLDAVGAALVLAERRPRPFKLELAVHGAYSDADERAGGLRLRRQLRQLLENARWRAHGLFFYFQPDPELAAWLLIGGGDLSEQDPGVSFGEFTLELSDCYMRGRPGTHRTARRLDLADRRTGLVTRDTRGLLYSTDYAATDLPAYPAILPGDVVNVTGAAGATPASSPGPAVGVRRLFRAFAAVDGEVLSYLPDAARMPDPARAPLELEEAGGVRAWDRRDSPSGGTQAGDLNPVLYGWERVLGQTLDPAPELAADNGLCRMVWLGDGPEEGLALEAWDPSSRTYVRHARVLHATGVREASVLELTYERCVLEWRAGASIMRAILQRGWYGPRLEAYGGGSSALYVVMTGGTGAGAASSPAWVTDVTNGAGRRLAGAQSHEAVTWSNTTAGSPLNGTTGRWATAGPVLAVQTALSDTGPDTEALAALSLVDAQSIPVLIARGA